MKNKIKEGIFYFFIISGIFLVVLILCNLLRYNPVVEFPSLDGFNKKIELYKEAANKLKDGECKDFIISFIDKVKDSNYEGKVNIKKLYTDNTILTNYTKAKYACGFTDEILNENYVSTMYMSAIIPYEYIYKEHMFAYEITLRDSLEEAFEVSLFNATENIKRNNELSIIEKYIELASEVQNEE